MIPCTDGSSLASIKAASASKGLSIFRNLVKQADRQKDREVILGICSDQSA